MIRLENCGKKQCVKEENEEKWQESNQVVRGEESHRMCFSHTHTHTHTRNDERNVTQRKILSRCGRTWISIRKAPKIGHGRLRRLIGREFSTRKYDWEIERRRRGGSRNIRQSKICCWITRHFVVFSSVPQKLWRNVRSLTGLKNRLNVCLYRCFV